MADRSFHDDLKKMRQQNWKDNLWFIWEYYKVPIIILIAVCIIISQICGAVYRNMQESMLYVALASEPAVTDRQLKQFQSSFDTLQGYDRNWRQTTTFESGMNLSVNDTASDKDGLASGIENMLVDTASQIRFQSLINTNTIDVLILPENLARIYCEQNCFLSLTDVLSDDILQTLSEQNRLLSAADSDGLPIVHAIRLEKTSMTIALGLTDDAVLCVCTLSNHPDVIRDFIRFALDM